MISDYKEIKVHMQNIDTYKTTFEKKANNFATKSIYNCFQVANLFINFI